MINNYYKDEEDASVTPRTITNTALGEYCSLGHFDALHVELLDCEKEQLNPNVRAKINETVVKKFDGRYNTRNVVCVTYDDAGDEEFWKGAGGKPFLFVSLVNIKQIGAQELENLIRSFNRINNVMAYYTYDHSEIAVLRAEESYVHGFKEILCLYDKMDIFKMYTVFAIKEDALEECENVCEEVIDCRLFATVKNRGKAGEFKKELANVLQKEDTEIKMYQTLGNSDCILEIPQISIKKILYCYKMGRLLTHTNEYYKQAFFNIESQFLVEGKENESMGD